MAESASKKEKNKKKALKKKEKLAKREDRKTNNNKGKSLEELLIYVDINGVLTTTPPHLQNQEIRKREVMEAEEFIGFINYQNDKGYGFISEENSNNSIFFHNNQLTQAVNKGDKVSFKKENSDKGIRAIQIKKVY